jgi:hypothetical protein
MRKLVCRSTLLIYALIAVGLSSLALGDETSKRAKIDELMVLEKREEIVEQMLEDHKRHSQEVTSQQLEHYRKTLHLTDTDPYYARMVAASQQFRESGLPPYTAKEATAIYAGLLAEHLDEVDIDALLSFARSPVGQRAVAASRIVAPEWQETLSQRAQESRMKAYKLYLDEMVTIAADRRAKQRVRQTDPRGRPKCRSNKNC